MFFLKRNKNYKIGIKRFECIEAEPLFACGIRGSAIKKLTQSTPWLRINCNKEYKKKRKMRWFMLLLPIVIMAMLTGGVCVSINEYKKNYEEYMKTEGVALQSQTTDEDLQDIILVNSKNPVGKKDFDPCLRTYETIKCDEKIIKDLQCLMNKAKENSLNIKVAEGYRDKESLDKAYCDMVNDLMEKENYTRVRADDRAQRAISKSKFSEQTTGLLVNLELENNSVDFTESKEYKWLVRNCADYGFILRYPKNKESKTGRDFNPHCFRYVGKKHAKKMKMLSKCLEEYCSYLKLDYKY